MKDTIAELKRLQADTESTTDIVSVVQARMRRDKAAGHALPDLLAAAEAGEKLRAALAQIQGGSFEEAVRYALDGRWQDFATNLQEIARAALASTDNGGGT